MEPKLTKKRQVVLDTIDQSQLPITAQDIFASLQSQMDLATVYRTLTYLEQARLIEGFAMNSNSQGAMRYYYRLEHPHRHFLYCEECNQFTPFEDCVLASSKKKIEKKYKYKINTHVLYFTGVCGECG
jgi:Fur family transcriptional regulator, ferric uptake regulator